MYFRLRKEALGYTRTICFSYYFSCVHFLFYVNKAYINNALTIEDVSLISFLFKNKIILFNISPITMGRHLRMIEITVISKFPLLRK